MPGRSKIGDAPNGEDSAADGTEKIPVSGSKWMYVSTIAAYIRTLTQTLTNKTIDLTSNTLTGTKAQFNTAMSDADFATLAGAETLSGPKTLTAPVIADFTAAQHDHGDADDGGTALASPTITTPTISGAIVFPDNVRQTFNPGADAAGLNVGSHAGDPGTPSNGDLWYDSVANELTARIGGANIALGAGGGGSVATDAIWDVKGDLAGGTGANTAARLAVGTNGQVLTADSAEVTGLKWAAAGSSSVVVKSVITQSGAVGTTTTIMPADDTIPQNTEGGEFMTVAITPASATNILYIDITVFATSSTTGWIVAALFQDATAGALAATMGYTATATAGVPLHLRYKMVSGTTSATTFKVRAGMGGAGTLTFNGQSAGRLLGGVMASSITVEEQTP